MKVTKGMEYRLLTNKMTAKDALKYSIILWKWLAKSGAKEKALCDIFDVSDMSADCALCEYVAQKHDNKCKKCPMYGQWLSKDGECGSFQESTVYEKWDYAENVVDRKFYARMMYYMLKRRYKEIK